MKSEKKRYLIFNLIHKFAAWDQSDKFVKVYLTGLKGVQDLPKESVTQEFTKKSARVRVEGLKGQNPTFFIKELCKEIDPDKSYVKVKSDMVSVFLAKPAEPLRIQTTIYSCPSSCLISTVTSAASCRRESRACLPRRPTLTCW